MNIAQRHCSIVEAQFGDIDTSVDEASNRFNKAGRSATDVDGRSQAMLRPLM